ncbi:MAG TPA: hypothetical protein VND22_09565 [Actinomycetota bacterium]|nr:hypothetical protein [Actinomycetota bacterium]
MTKPRRIMVVLLTTAFLAGCFGPEEAGTQPMEVRVLTGTARVMHEGQSKSLKTRGAIEVGDRVVVPKNSAAEVRLAGARRFELTGGEVRVDAGNRLTLQSGLLLGIVRSRAAVESGSFSVSAGNGTFRVDRGISARVASYRGGALRVSGPGSRLEVPPLRQAVIAGSEIPRAPDPLRVSAGDQWDRRFLSEVIETDESLTNFARGLEAQLGPDEGVSFFQRVLPEVDSSFIAAFAGNRRADLLIGLLLAMEAEGNGRTVAERFTSAFNLWSEGASWGLVAYEFKVKKDAIFTRLLDAIQRAGLEIVGVTGAPPSPSSRRPSSGPSPSPTPGGRGPDPSPAPSPGGSPSPSPSSPTPSPVQSILDDLLGGSDGGQWVPLIPALR